jgi:acetyltransferase-like isoleucine patch superfamily enzyme
MKDQITPSLNANKSPDNHPKEIKSLRIKLLRWLGCNKSSASKSVPPVTMYEPCLDKTDNRTPYERSVQSRTKMHYLLGLYVRWKQNRKYEKIRRVARQRGATIGKGVMMPMSLAKKLNSNVTIGNHVSILTDTFTTIRFPITIGNNVIIGSGVKITMGGHRIDSPDWDFYRPNPGLVIEDYVWLCPDSVILPGVAKIGYGAVVGANAVVVKSVEPMSVVGGNPAKELKKRSCVHSDLVIESLGSGDYEIYKQTWKKRERH